VYVARVGRYLFRRNSCSVTARHQIHSASSSVPSSDRAAHGAKDLPPNFTTHTRELLAERVQQQVGLRPKS
jgi:hypothetical protein